MAKKGYAAYSKLEYDRDIELVLDELDPIQYPDRGDTVVLFSTRNHVHYTYIYPLFAKELLDRGIPTYFLFFHPVISDTFPDLTINNIQVSNALRVQEYPYLYRSGQIGYPYYNWNIDIDNEYIFLEGLEDINIFHPIQSTIRKDQKRYNIDYNDPQTAMAVQRAIFTADEIFRYMQIMSVWADQLDLEIRLVGWETCYVLQGYMHQFCRSDMTPDCFEYVHLSTFYGHYFGDAVTFGTDLGVTNLTVRGVHRKYKGFKKEFDEYKENILSSPEKTDQVREEVLENMREHSIGAPKIHKRLVESDRLNTLQEKIDKTKDNGNKVYALYAHKFYDVGITDTAPAFEDMCGWIDYTLDLFRDRDDLLILKPHPGEVDPDNPQQEPKEKLADYVEGKLSDNIFLLDPRDMNSSSVYRIVDGGLVWRSTVGLEMIAFGIPCLVVGDAYYREYVDLHTPYSKQEYIRMIKNLDQLEINSQAQTDAAVFFHYFRNERHHHLDYIQGTDYKDLRPDKVKYDREMIENFLREGDEEIEGFLPEFNIPEIEPIGETVDPDLRFQPDHPESPEHDEPPKAAY